MHISSIGVCLAFVALALHFPHYIGESRPRKTWSTKIISNRCSLVQIVTSTGTWHCWVYLCLTVQLVSGRGNLQVKDFHGSVIIRRIMHPIICSHYPGCIQRGICAYVNESVQIPGGTTWHSANGWGHCQQLNGPLTSSYTICARFSKAVDLPWDGK